MANLPLDAQIEALLFYKGSAVSKRELTRIFGVNMVAINDSIGDLRERLKDRGVSLVEKDTEVAMTTSPEMSELITEMEKEELSKDLGKASLETLSIILYRGGATRREIEYIRGVNSTSILRTLLIRGLVERTTDAKDERVYMYKSTMELQTTLGLKTLEELPELAAVRAEFDTFEEEQLKADQEDTGERDKEIAEGNLEE